MTTATDTPAVPAAAATPAPSAPAPSAPAPVDDGDEFDTVWGEIAAATPKATNADVDESVTPAAAVPKADATPPAAPAAGDTPAVPAAPATPAPGDTPATPAAPAPGDPAAPAAGDTPAAPAAPVAPVAPVVPKPPVTPAAPAAPTAAEIKAQEEHDARIAALLKPYEPTAEQQAALDVLEKEWPDQAKAMKTMLAAQAKAHEQALYKNTEAVLAYMNNQLGTVSPAVQNLVQAQHVNAITTAHPDIQTVLPQVEAWVAGQPELLKKPFEAVLKEGSTQEVIDLVAHYKAQVKPVVPVTPATPAAPVAPAVPAAQIAAVRTVRSGRVTPSAKGAPDPDDYEGAWAEAAQAHRQ